MVESLGWDSCHYVWPFVLRDYAVYSCTYWDVPVEVSVDGNAGSQYHGLLASAFGTSHAVQEITFRIPCN